MSLVTWSWLFFVAYIGGMLLIGWIAQRRVANADDFATARRSYGPFVLALAFAASIASGSTFLGSPGLSYQWGLASIWSKFLYPMGVYIGVLICMRLISTAGDRFGNRSIPEYLGDRYQSNGIRVLVAIMSLILFFYVAGQLVSGVVMFHTMLGVSPTAGITLTALILLVYVALGGAHADILTDGAQGLLMLLVAFAVIFVFLSGFGTGGGITDIVDNLREQDASLAQPLNPNTPLFHSWWAILSVMFAHVPLGLLPHMGNKLWALKDSRSRMRFVVLAYLFGSVMAFIGLGGLVARVMFGDALIETGTGANQALPMLFIEIFPTWLAALIGVGILSAIMSTTDGLIVSSSQVIANDIYRRTLVPRMKNPPPPEEIDRRVLSISRISTFVVLIICMMMAMALLDRNITLIVWVGTGGMMAAFAGPLIVGALWRGVTRTGAYAGLVAGLGAFMLVHAQVLNPVWFPDGILRGAADWLYGEGPNPFSCTAIGEFASIIVTVAVSRLTRPLPAEHVDSLFDADTTDSRLPAPAIGDRASDRSRFAERAEE